MEFLYLLSESFCQKSVEKKSPKKYCFIPFYCGFLTWLMNCSLTSSNSLTMATPTHTPSQMHTLFLTTDPFSGLQINFFSHPHYLCQNFLWETKHSVERRSEKQVLESILIVDLLLNWFHQLITGIPRFGPSNGYKGILFTDFRRSLYQIPALPEHLTPYEPAPLIY